MPSSKVETMRLACILVLACAGLGSLPSLGVAAGKFDLPQGPGRDLIYARCQTCHDLQYVVESAGITGSNWAELIDSMRQYGLRIPAEEQKEIVRYLATYLGPGGPPAAAPGAPPGPAAEVDGKAAFARTCSACHQSDGRGLARTFPPLSGNRDLFIDRLFPVYVALNGIEGPITVNGEAYDGVMPPFDHLSDAEVAALVNYIRSAWGNERLRPAGLVDVDAAAVAQARQKRLRPKDVNDYRAAHR